MSRATPILTLHEAVTIQKVVTVEVDNKIEQDFEEWKDLKRKFGILNMIAEKIANRISDIEQDIKSIVKESAGQQVQIDEATAIYKTRKTTSVSYKDLFEKAFAMVNVDQQKVLTQYKDTITSKGLSESLKIEDPKLAEFLESLKYVSIDDLLSRMKEIKEIPDKAPDFVTQAQIGDASSIIIEGAISDKFKKIWTSMKSFFTASLGKLKEALKKSGSSADLLTKTVKG